MLKIIFASIFVLLVWAAWFFLQFHIVIPIAITALVAAVFVALFVARRVRARNAARELEKALAAQAEDHRRGARPDLQAEIQAMQSEFDKAVRSLKNSKLGDGAEALYALPWHVIIGPPGAGKSTALRNSGLQFPYMGSKGGAIKGIGGTRNCDWWLCNEAVILDTAGRWSTEEDDRDEWVSFLDLLRRHRPRKPLNGVMVAVSVTDVASLREEEVTALAAQMRRRIDEVGDRLQMSLPVYVVFTKCDLVPGFVETYSDLTREQRGQLWGFTAPISEPIGEPGRYFAARFSELAEGAEQRSLKRMGDERKIETRESIHAFPQQFAALEQNLATFVSKVFEENTFRESPRMRGCYFTSGTQEGRPIDLVMSRMAEAFGIRGELPLGEPVVEQKSYFLRDVFSKVIFLDTDLAVRSEAEQKRERVERYIAAAAIFGLALLVSVLPAISYAKNSSMLDDLDAVVEGAAAHVGGDAIISPEELEPIRAATDDLHQNEDGAPVMMRLGMYQGGKVYPAMRNLYVHVLRRNVLRPMVSADTSALNAFGRRYEALGEDVRPTAEEHNDYYDRLKTHLLLTQPKGADEPPIEGDLRAWLSDRIVEGWAAAASIPEGDARREQMGVNSELFLTLMTSDPDQLAFTRDVDAVRLTRAALTRVPYANVALDRVIESADGQGYDLTLTSIIGTTVSSYRSEVIGADGTRRPALIRGAFTRRAWEERIREMLSSTDSTAISGEAWVLGRDMPTTDEGQQAALLDLRSRFFDAYIEEWQQFIRALRVRPPNGNTEALAMLQDLTRGDPVVLARFMGRVHYNSQLLEEQDAASPEGDAAASGLLTTLEQRMRRSEAGRAALAIAGAEEGEDAAEPDSRRLTNDDVKTAFHGFTIFGVPPPPASEGEEPPPVALDVYQEQLGLVRDSLQTHLDSPDDGEELLGRLQAARTRVRALIEEQEVGWRPRFEAILWPPIDGASMSATRALATGAGRSWCAEVVRPYYRNLRGRYPFSESGLDVPLADFSQFYAPETGTLWAFYGEALGGMVERDGDRFQFNQQFGREGHFNRVLLTHLARSQEISSAFFPPGQTDPKVQMDVRIRPTPEVQSVLFTLGGAEIEYHNGPEEWTRMEWPGESPEAGALLEIRGADGMHERVEQSGEWGLFRVLERGTVTEGGGGSSVFQVTWRLRTHDVDIKVDFRPVRGETPFFGVRGRDRDGALMHPLRADGVYTPREIVSRARLCNIESS